MGAKAHRKDSNNSNNLQIIALLLFVPRSLANPELYQVVKTDKIEVNSLYYQLQETWNDKCLDKLSLEKSRKLCFIIATSLGSFEKCPHAHSNPKGAGFLNSHIMLTFPDAYIALFKVLLIMLILFH